MPLKGCAAGSDCGSPRYRLPGPAAGVPLSVSLQLLGVCVDKRVYRRGERAFVVLDPGCCSPPAVYWSSVPRVSGWSGETVDARLCGLSSGPSHHVELEPGRTRMGRGCRRREEACLCGPRSGPLLPGISSVV